MEWHDLIFICSRLLSSCRIYIKVNFFYFKEWTFFFHFHIFHFMVLWVCQSVNTFNKSENVAVDNIVVKMEWYNLIFVCHGLLSSCRIYTCVCFFCCKEWAFSFFFFFHFHIFRVMVLWVCRSVNTFNKSEKVARVALSWKWNDTT